MSTGGVRLEGIWKAYPRLDAGGRTLRAVVSRRLPVALRGGERSWALRDVSLVAAAGESVGLIGANGAGKSTLLRLAAGLGRPTRGRVTTEGRVSAVLSLGATLDPRLSGRENALTAAMVAGLRRREAHALVPAALAFAELEEVAHAPVRTYSEGMRLRLAFGVVAQLEPDVLLLDEVLAVGDLAFQARCLARVRELRERGTTLVFASHDLDQVGAECERAAWLDNGRVAAAGPVEAVIARYEEAAQERVLARTPEPAPDDHGPLRLRENRVGTQAVTIEGVAVAPGDVPSGGAVTIAVDLRAHRPRVVDPIVMLRAHRAGDDLLCFEAATHGSGARLGSMDGAAQVTLSVERLELVPGDYLLDVAVFSADWEETFDYHGRAYALRVGGPGPSRGVLRTVLRWEVRAGQKST